MLVAEREIEAGLRNVVAAISSALRPGTVIASPVLSTILLKCTMPLPGALRRPSPLLLPGDCLLLGTLGLRLLTGLAGSLRLLLSLRLRPLRLGLLRLLPLL